MLNFDLEPECVDGELRAALQWIAASELGVPALYFRKSPEHNLAKVRANGGHAQRFVKITNQVWMEFALAELTDFCRAGAVIHKILQSHHV